jgi:hypothetical protein
MAVRQTTLLILNRTPRDLGRLLGTAGGSCVSAAIGSVHRCSNAPWTAVGNPTPRI